MLLSDLRDAPQSLFGTLFDLAATHPGAVPFVARPAVADRLGLSVADERDGLAVGLLGDADGAAHVCRWEVTLEARERYPVPTPATGVEAATVLALLPQPGYVVGQWVRIDRHRSVN